MTTARLMEGVSSQRYQAQPGRGAEGAAAGVHGRRSGDVEVFDIKLFRALTTYQFTERMLLRNTTEFNTFADTVGLNFLVTYRINAGTLF